MKAIITVLSTDREGIIAQVSGKLYEHGINILDISQSVMREYFAMIMLVEITDMKVPFADFAATLKALGESKNLEIHAMHEDIFNSMHRI